MKKIVVSLVAISLFLVGCGGEKSEKDRYIDASVEMACNIVQNNELLKDTEAALNKAMEIFENNGFAVEDLTAMQILSEKYNGDVAVSEAVKAGVTKCAASSLSNS